MVRILVAFNTFRAEIMLLIIIGRYSKPKKEQVVAAPRSPDVELATLRELPRRGVHNTNVLYVSTQQPIIEEITMLPHIVRENISLMKFLGSGAFGEVYEGTALGISTNNAPTKVAIKVRAQCPKRNNKSRHFV